MSERGHLLLAVVTDICDDDVTYPSCRVCCGKLFLDHQSSDQRFFCLKCGGSCPLDRVQRRYRLVLTVADGEVTGRVVVFGRTLDVFFGKTATDFHRSLSELGKSGYPAEAMLSETLIKTFHGKYFYFGFKTTHHGGIDGPVTLKDCLSIAAHTDCSQNKAPHDKEVSHTLVYQMFPSNDGVYATVTDHMRYTVKALKHSRKEGLLQDPVFVEQVQTEFPVSYKNLSAFSESDSENSSLFVSKSLCSKQMSIMFSFENDTSDLNFREILLSDNSKIRNNDLNSWKRSNRQNQSPAVRSITYSVTHDQHETGDCGHSEDLCVSPLSQYPVTQKLNFSAESEPNILDHMEHNTGHYYHSFVEPSTGVKIAQTKGITAKHKLKKNCHELSISKEIGNLSPSVFLKTSTERNSMDDGAIAERKTQQNIVGVSDDTVQTLYLPESEDLEAFLDTFEEDSLDFSDTIDNSSDVSQPDIDTAKVSELTDPETVTNDSNVHFVNELENVIQQTEEDSCYDGICKSYEDIEDGLCSQGTTRNTDGTTILSPPLEVKVLYLPDSEDIEQFLNSFEEGVSCQFSNVTQEEHTCTPANSEKNPNKNKPNKLPNFSSKTESHEKNLQGKVVHQTIATFKDNVDSVVKLVSGNSISPMNENGDEAKSYVPIAEDDSGFCQQGEFDAGSKEMEIKCARTEQFQEKDPASSTELNSETKPLSDTKEWGSYDVNNLQESISYTGMKELVLNKDMALGSQSLSLETMKSVVDNTSKTNLHVNDSKELELFLADISLENEMIQLPVQLSCKPRPTEACMEKPIAKEIEKEQCTCEEGTEDIVTSAPKSLDGSLDGSLRQDSGQFKKVLEKFNEDSHRLFRYKDNINNMCSTFEELKENDSYHSGVFSLSSDNKTGYDNKSIPSRFEESTFNSSGDLFGSFSFSGKPEHIEIDSNSWQNSNCTCLNSQERLSLSTSEQIQCICSLVDKDSLSCENAEIITESQDIVELKLQAIRFAKNKDRNITWNSPSTCLMGKRVQFEERLQQVTTCHLLDIQMKRCESPADKLKLEFPLKSCMKSKDTVETMYCDRVGDVQLDKNVRTKRETAIHCEDTENCHLQAENSDTRPESDKDLSVIGGSQDLFESPITPVQFTETWNKQDCVTGLFDDSNIIPCSTTMPFQISLQTDSPDLFETCLVMTPDLFSPADITSQETIPSKEEYSLEQVRNSSFEYINSSSTKSSEKRISNVKKPFKKNHISKYLVENTPEIRHNRHLHKEQVGSANQLESTLPCYRNVLREVVANYQDSPDLFDSPADTIDTSDNTGLHYLQVLSKSSELCKQLFF